MVDTLHSSREAATPKVGSQTTNKSNLLTGLAGMVLASSVAAMAPAKAEAAGFADGRIDTEQNAQIMGVNGMGFKARPTYSADKRDVSIVSGPGGSVVTVDASCPLGYTLGVHDTAMKYELHTPDAETAKYNNVAHVDFTTSATGNEPATLKCETTDGDPIEMQVLIASNAHAALNSATASSNSRNRPLPAGFRFGLGLALQPELIENDDKFAMGFGGDAYVGYRLKDNLIDLTGVVMGGHFAEDTDDVFHSGPQIGQPSGEVVLSRTPVIGFDAEVGLNLFDNALRGSAGVGVIHAFGHDTDTNTKVKSGTYPVAAFDVSAFFGDYGAFNVEAGARLLTDFKKDRPNILMIHVGPHFTKPNGK